MKLLLENWRLFSENEEKYPQVVYHGTSLNRWNKLKQGGYKTDLLYFAINPDGTDMYSRMAVENDEISGILPEDNPAIMVHLDLAQLEANGELGRDWDDTPEGLSWEESIEYGGTASFRGNLKNAIKKVEVFE